MEEVKGRPLTFLAFDDEKPGGNRRPQLTKTFHGSLDDHGEVLDRLNRAGAGIFVTVNQTDLKGRKKANIAALRAWWADLDEKNALEDFDLARVPLAPSMQVRSGHGTHLYWIPAAPIPCHEDETRRGAHEAELRALAAALVSFGADSDVCDVPRVMRLPGFYNRKRAPFPLVELVTAGGPACTREQIQAAFPQHETVSEPGHGAAPIQASSYGRPSNWRERVAAFVATCSPSVQGQKGAPSLFVTCLKLYSRFDLLPEEVVEVVMSDYNVPGVCIPEWSLAEVQRKAAEADKAAGPDRGTAWSEYWPTVEKGPATRGQEVDAPIPGSPKPVSGPGAPAEGKVSPATKALQVALAAGAEPWVGETRTPFITVPMGSHVEHYRLKADPESPAGRWLAGIYYRTFRKALGASVKRDVLENLIADAMASDRAFPTARRIFRKGDRVFLDLCTPSWEVVEVGAEGWKVCPAAAVPVRFTRAASMLPLPCPVRGGSVEALRPFFNCGEDDFRLVVAWALTALSGGREYPVLVFGGEPGSAKSTATRYARDLVDPNAAPLRKTPKEERDLFIAAKNAFVLTFDNLSQPPEWLPDALCALALDTGYACRALYTDDEESVFRVAAPIILNGISEQLTRSDLADRALSVTLHRIDQEHMKPKDELDAAFNTALPAVLGAFLDVLSSALGHLPHVHLDRYPRLAQTAKLMAAAEPFLGWAPGTFARLFEAAQATVAANVTEGDPVALALQDLARRGGPRFIFEGTCTDLRVKLEQVRPNPMPSVWPPAPNKLSERMKRIAPQLRLTGWEVVLGSRDGTKKNARLLRLSYPAPVAPRNGGSDDQTMVTNLSSEPRPLPGLDFGRSDDSDDQNPIPPYAIDPMEHLLDIPSDDRNARTIDPIPSSGVKPASVMGFGRSDDSDGKITHFSLVENSADDPTARTMGLNPSSGQKPAPGLDFGRTDDQDDQTSHFSPVVVTEL